MKVLRQIVKFMLVGAVAFGVDFGLYTTLTRTVDMLQPYYVAVSVATSAVAVMVAYVFNHYWTFRQMDEASWRYASRYFAVAGSGLLIQNALLAMLVEVVGLYDLVAKVVVVMVVGLCWNFALSRLWVFGSKVAKVT